MVLAGLVAGKERVVVPLESVDVSVTIHGFLVNVEASLTYRNARSAALDVVFVYFVDDNGAVYKFEADIDGRQIKAEIQEKVQAELTYEEATARGMTAVLMEEEQDASGDIFRCKLGNLPPDSDAKLQLSFVTELTHETDGSLKFVLPTVLNPRYYPEGEDKETMFDLFARNSCQYKLSFKGSVGSKHGISRVWSNTDKLITTLMAEGSNTMAIGLSEEFRPNHSLSFSVLYEDTHKPQATLEKGTADCLGTLFEKDILMLSFYPDLSISTEQVKSEFIFIIDRSASMHGQPILNAQETLLYFLKSLPVDCYFNVISFGSSCEALFPRSVRYGQSTLQRAMELQASLTANMVGTELVKPLSLVYSRQPQPGYTRQMFLLTDGDVFNIADIVSLVRRNAPESRVFTVGIGDAVSLPLVRNVAKAGRGQVELVRGSEKLQEKVMKLLRHAMQPAVTDLVIDFHLPAGLAVTHRLPQDMPDIFQGQRCTFYGFLTGEMRPDTSTVGKAMMSGRVGGNTFTHTMTFDVMGDAVMTSGYFVHRRAMKTIVDDLEDQERDYGTNKKREIIVASMAGNIISKYSSFVGIDTKTNERIYEPVRTDVPLVAMATEKNENLDQEVKTERLSPKWQIFNRKIPKPKWRKRRTLSQELKLNVKFSRHKDPVCVSNRDDLAVYEDHQSTCSNSSARPRTKPHRCLPRCSCFSWMFPSPRTKSTEEDVENRSICGVDDVTLGDSDHEEGADRPSCTVVAKASRMVAWQEYDGSWSLTRELADVVDTTKDTLRDKAFSVDEKVWATGLAICWLTLKCADERSVWEMVVNKARDWLVGQLGGQEEVDSLLGEAESVLSL